MNSTVNISVIFGKILAWMYKAFRVTYTYRNQLKKDINSPSSLWPERDAVTH